MSEGDSSDDTGDKPHDATPRKLEEARRKGNLPRSADLTATAALVGMLLVALLPGGGVAIRLGDLGLGLLDRADAIGAAMLGGGTAVATVLLRETALALAPVAVIPIAAVLATLLAIRGLVLAPEKLVPKLERISPVATARQKFGPSGLFEFGKSTLKLLVYCVVLVIYLGQRLSELMILIALGPNQVAAALMRMTLEFLMVVALVMAVVSAADYLFQRFDHLRQQRMTDRELRDEVKSSEGDPHLKQARRARAEKLATNRMLAEVPTASVVIVNPTHVAVALRWSPQAGGAPVCVAKGTDEIALRIREAAEAARVPIRHDPPTARALHATTRLGQEVQPDHYAPVAAAIRFADQMRQRARNRLRR